MIIVNIVLQGLTPILSIKNPPNKGEIMPGENVTV